MADSVEDEIPEDCLCPICFELFAKQVFQCINGHVICDSCVKSVTSCPQCRVSYNGAPIRVRIHETTLDRMHFSCKYKHNGCQMRLKRAEVARHNDTCEHGGTLVSFCEVFGLPCNSKANTKKMLEAIGHLICDHGIHVEDRLSRFTLQMEKPFEATSTQECKRQWTPILLETSDPNSRIILSVVTGTDSKSYSLDITVTKLRINVNADMKPIQVEFTVKVEVNGKMEAVAWKQAAGDIENCDAWRLNQILRFGRHSTHHEFSIDCVIFVDGRTENVPLTQKKIVRAGTLLCQNRPNFGAIVGEYVLVSSSNYDDFLARLRVGLFARITLEMNELKLRWMESNKNWTQKNIYPSGTMEIKFYLGKEFKHLCLFGRKCHSVISIDGNILTQKHRTESHSWEVKREFKGNEMISTLKCGDVVATQTFSKVVE